MTFRTSRRIPRVLVAAVGALLGIAVGTTAAAVPIRGSVQLPRDFAPPSEARENGPAGFYWEEWNGVLDLRPPRLDVEREIAVVLTGEGDSPGSDFQLSGGALRPSTMVARSGDMLRIANTDPCAHELFADGIEGLAVLQTAPGNARTLALTQVGHWLIQDRLYPHVKGYLHVIADLVARGTVQQDGRYAFSDVAPGGYTLKVFYRDRMVHSQRVEVEEGRELTIEPVALDLTTPRQ